MNKSINVPPAEELDDFTREIFYPDYGTVGGRKLELCRIYEDVEIDQMSVDSLREEFRFLSEAYKLTLVKMLQYRSYVPAEVKNRDPSVRSGIQFYLRQGYTDEEIALALGESVRFIQRCRLEMDESGVFKRPRGRPRKSLKD